MDTTSTDAAKVLAGRYEIERPLGRGGQARTYLARRLDDGAQVVVKELRFGQVSDWKPVELFKREAAVLESLEHQVIPSYIDSFELEEGGSTRLYLVQEYIQGENLAEAVSSGFHIDEQQARDIAHRLLDVLDYLHSQSPPVIHRDLKPSNIIRGVDDELYLVDFGAARQALASGRDGSTVVGTAGYVPPEQLHGGAVAASDLYALGATLVFLLTRRPPDELPAERMKLKFRQAANVSEAFASFLDRLIEPDVSKRLPSASSAKAALARSERQLAPKKSGGLASKLRAPHGSGIVVSRRPGELTATLPRRMTGEAWGMSLSTMIFLAVSMFNGGMREALLGMSAAGIFLMSICLLLAVSTLAFYLKRTRLTLSNEGFAVEHDIAGVRWGKTVDINQFVGLRQKNVRAGRHSTEPALVCPNGWGKEVIFGRGLSGGERKWLVELFGRGTEALHRD